MLSLKLIRSAILICALIGTGSCITMGFNCSKSSACQKELDQLRIEEIKRTILAELHMVEPPVLSKNISEEMRAMYEKIAEQMDEEHNRNDVESQFYPGRDPSAGEDGSQLVAVFDVPGNLITDDLLEAKLSFYVKLPDAHTTQDVYVRVYEKNEDGSLGETVATTVISYSGKGRVEIELPAETVRNWFTDSPLAGVFVSAIVDGHNVAIHPQQSSSPVENMILQLTTVPRGSRSRRHTVVPVCSYDSPSLGCCLYDLLIDFDRLGWDWVIAPRRYNAYICRGNCHYNRHHFALAETGHAKVMGVAHRMSSKTADDIRGVGYCCYPTEYDYVRMIYINRQGRISVGNIKGMVARKCTCG